MALLLHHLWKIKSYVMWKIDNATVISWLLHSIHLDTNSVYLLLPTAKDIWTVVNKTYAKLSFTLKYFN